MRERDLATEGTRMQLAYSLEQIRNAEDVCFEIRLPGAGAAARQRPAGGAGGAGGGGADAVSTQRAKRPGSAASGSAASGSAASGYDPAEHDPVGGRAGSRAAAKRITPGPRGWQDAGGGVLVRLRPETRVIIRLSYALGLPSITEDNIHLWWRRLLSYDWSLAERLGRDAIRRHLGLVTAARAMTDREYLESHGELVRMRRHEVARLPTPRRLSAPGRRPLNRWREPGEPLRLGDQRREKPAGRQPPRRGRAASGLPLFEQDHSQDGAGHVATGDTPATAGAADRSRFRAEPTSPVQRRGRVEDTEAPTLFGRGC